MCMQQLLCNIHLTGFFTESRASPKSQLLHSSIQLSTSNENPSENSGSLALDFCLARLVGLESFQP